VTGAAPFALAAAPVGRSEPGSLALRLEILRLQAELASLEARIAEFGSSDAAAEGEAAVEETELLVERMVASLRQAGRDEIESVADRRRRQAQAQLDEARRRSELILAGARAEVAAALAERERSVARTLDGDLDSVVLPDVPAPAAMPEPVVAAGAVGVSKPVATDPVPTPRVAVEVVAPTAMDVEEARTDAAFDVWMAVAPEVADDAPGEPVAPTVEPLAPVVDAEHRRGSRSRWILPLEVAAALLAALILVVLVLALVG
jgi:hypothetical protein